MQNTGTVYSSTERTPTVLPEMAELLPPLLGEQLAALEADILKNIRYNTYTEELELTKLTYFVSLTESKRMKSIETKFIYI